MAARVGRIAGLLTVAVILSGHACGATEEANQVDHERIEVMRTDPVYSHLLDGGANEGQRINDDFSHNRYVGRVDPWRGQPPPEQPTGAEIREQIQAMLADLRTGGWTVVAATCRLRTSVEDAATSSPRVHMSYSWDASGYRVQDGVPYAFALEAVHGQDLAHGDAVARDPWTRVSVWMSAPFHADPDTDTYLTSPPETLPAGETCIERAEPPDLPADLDLTEFRGSDETAVDGPGRYHLS